MRKVAFALTLMGIGVFSANSAFANFYISAGVGTYSFGAQNSTTISSIPVAPTNYTGNAIATQQGIAALLAGGYDFSITPLFSLGIEVRFAPQSQTLHTTPYQTSYVNMSTGAIVVAQSDNQVGIAANSAQLLLKPELLVTDNSYVYALLGGGYAQAKFTSSVNFSATGVPGATFSTPQMTTTKTVMPLVYGMGYMQYIMPNLSFFAEVTDAYYPKVETQQNFQGMNIQASSQTINSLATILGLSYHF